MQKIQQVNLSQVDFKEEVELSQNNTYIEFLKPHGKCRATNNEVDISGSGWDNCCISKRIFTNFVFSVGISDWRGSVILKIRLQDQHNPASNSYHVILGEWGNYVAKSCHVFKRLTIPSGNPIHLHLIARGSQMQVLFNYALVAQFDDHDLKEGYVSFGVKDGQARFLNPKVKIFN
jgi:hypothetical protein